MKTQQKIIFIFILTVLFFISCKSPNFILNKDTEEIINVVLKEYDSVSLIRETFHNDISVRPINVLNPYYRVYSYGVPMEHSPNKLSAYSIFFNDVNGIISKSELDEIKERYNSWSIKEWKESNIKNPKVNLVPMEIFNHNYKSLPKVRLSEPLYTQDKKKAILYEYYLKNKNGGQGIRILAKENGKWIIKGSIPIGTSG